MSVGNLEAVSDEHGDAPSPLHLIQPVSETIKSFPTTRYYGSKRKLLEWIYSGVGGLSFDTVLDAFGGSGSVSLLFRAMGKSVTYHDGLKFNEDVGRSLLAPSLAISRGDTCAIIDGTTPQVGPITRNFRNVFYTEQENRWLDGFMSRLVGLDQDQSALLRYLLYQACLKKRPFNLFHRANLYLRTNDAKRSFGNATTWERSFKHHMMQAYDELDQCLVRSDKDVMVLDAGNVEDIPPGFDLVYLDPPYVSREERYNRDDYWRRYHFLEGVARYEEWEDLLDRNSPIRLLKQPTWAPEWSSRRTFPERLYSLIRKHSDSIVVLSYVKGAEPSEGDLTEFFESVFAKVSIHSAEHSHALSKSKKRELLFIGEPG